MIPQRLFVFSFLLILSVQAGAQDGTKKFITAGAVVGYGPTFSDNTEYTVYFMAGDLSMSFGKPRKKDFLAWYAEPQVNFVDAGNGLDLEFGLNLGLRNYIRINDRLYFYQMLGSGPHFISARLDRQARGFIFSDNLILGGLIGMKKGFLNLQFGIRHISNANLKLPNRGVNTYVFRIGWSRVKYR